MASSITINSNLAALNAQRRLGQSTQSVQQAFTRLSSGLRINKASDDAAGLAIAESLNVDARVYTQGIRNLNDGLAALSIADTAVESLTNIVVRLEELAEQAANGTLGLKQRHSLDNEAQELSKEYFRISRTAKFNGQCLLDGTLPNGLTLQAGYGANGGITATVGKGLGAGSFGSKLTFATDTGSWGRSWATSLGDLNGDGVLDLVTAGQATYVGYASGQATVLLGRGDGTFGSKLTFATETGNMGGLSFAVSLGDLNGDGVLDLVTSGYTKNDGYTTGQATVLLGRGDGTFGSKLTFATETGSWGMSFGVSLGDLNGDSVLDLVTAGVANNQGQVTVLLGRGDGTFDSNLTFATETGISNGRSFAVVLGDLNGDGVLDLVTAGETNNEGYFSGQATVLLGRGDGTFGSKLTFATDTGNIEGHSNALRLGDLNGDGVLDLVTVGDTNNVGYINGQATVLLGRGDGTFGSKLTFATETGSTMGHSNALRLGDLNGDGTLDLVTAGQTNNEGYSGGQATVFLGRGDGTFDSNLTFATETGSNACSFGVSLGDLNGDGVLDLVTAGYTDGLGQVSVLTGLTREGVCPLLPFDLSALADARQALPVFKQKLSQLSAQRGQIGAAQTRLSVAVNTLQVSRENYLAAKSQITDVDVAEESAYLVKNQTLQQAGAAVLAQANTQPQIALTLLQEI